MIFQVEVFHTVVWCGGRIHDGRTHGVFNRSNCGTYREETTVNMINSPDRGGGGGGDLQTKAPFILVNRLTI